jgi:hypothetical protein
MKDKNTDFPQYRKLSNGKSFYKINSTAHFEECQIMASKVFYFEIHAVQYPEMLKINDLLATIEPYEPTTAAEFQQLFEKSM